MMCLVLVLALTACGVRTESAPQAETTPEPIAEAESPVEEEEPFEPDTETAEAEVAAEEEGARILIVYFSSANTTGPDVVSGAIDVWVRNWANVEQLFNYGSAVRKIMYTTNSIEALNSSFRTGYALYPA